MREDMGLSRAGVVGPADAALAVADETGTAETDAVARAAEADVVTAPAEHDEQEVTLAAEVFSLLSDATRIRIVLSLRGAERSVGELARVVGKSPTAVSQHLAKLRWGRMVRTRQEGNRVFYSLADAHAAHLVAEAVLQAQHVMGDRPRHDHGHGPAGGGHRRR